MKVPKNLYYTDTHEWVKVDGDKALIGITDFAQNELGEIVFVELPEESDPVEKGEEFSAVESTKAASEIMSPVSGVIVEVNNELEEAPELLNEDPYKYWIVKIELEDESELETLKDADAYQKLIEE